MNAPYAPGQHPRPSETGALLNEGADLASRSIERMLSTQYEGYRDWMATLGSASAPRERLSQHLDQGLQLGCALYVAQVSILTDAMQLLERTMAVQQRNLAAQLDRQPGEASASLKQALTVGGCAFDSLSKATRQVANFASNRFSAAARTAVQQARAKLAENP